MPRSWAQTIHHTNPYHLIKLLEAMKSIFKNIFNRQPQTNSTIESIMQENQPELPMIPKELFVETESPIAKQAKVNESDPLLAILDREHHSAGYNDGYTFHDSNRKQNYEDCLIEEVRDVFKGEVRRMDFELVRLNTMLKQKNELDISIVMAIQEQIDNVDLKRRHFMDEFESTEFARGKVRIAILNYERGFIEGFNDYLETSKFNSIIGDN
jgi:hypothetical protein